MSVVKLSWSGGKDSTCAFDMHIERGDFVKAVCYIPYFDDNTPLILSDHFEFLHCTAEKFIKRGAKVYFVRGTTYCEMFYKKISRGLRAGCVTGFPLAIAGKCKFSQIKKKAIDNCDVGYFDYEDIGIAFDEKNRMKKGKFSILIDEQMVEKECFYYCLDRHLLSPVYNRSGRDGCCLCPNGKASERAQWFCENPSVIPKIKEMQSIVIQENGYSPLRNCEWFIDPFQISIFE